MKTSAFISISIAFIVIILLIYEKSRSTLQTNIQEAKVSKNNQLKRKPADNKTVIELLNRNKINDICIVSISNWGYHELTENWIISLERLNFNKFVIFCFDYELFDYLVNKGYQNNVVMVPPTWLDYNVSAGYHSYGSKDYSHIVQSKVPIWLELLKLKFNIFFSDPDIVWLNANILKHVEFIYQYSKAELIMSQDQKIRQLNFNTGLFYARSTEFTMELFRKVIENQRKNPDQAMEQYILSDMLESINYNETRILGLDPILFASGMVYFWERINQKFNVKPYSVHANYYIGRISKKRALRSEGLWFVQATKPWQNFNEIV